jgi:hypothetical protein
MESLASDRVGKLIEAYFSEPREKYAELVHEIRKNGGLTSTEVRKIKDKLLYVHSDTIVRQAGLQDAIKA